MSDFPLALCSNITTSKTFKVSSDAHPKLFSQSKYEHKIKPICINYKKIQYRGDPKEIYKISTRGHKYLSRVAATGEYTADILSCIKKTPCIKFIRNLEFDPSLCETSCLRPFAEVLRKLKKSLYGLSLFFRRFTAKDELKTFFLNLERLKQITVLKIEFAREPPGMWNQDLSDLKKSSMRIYTVRFIDFIISGNHELNKIRGIFGQSKKMEKLKLHMYFIESRHSQPRPVDEQKEPAKPLKKKKTRFIKSFKHFNLKLSLKTGWASYFDGIDIGEGFQFLLKGLPYVVNPISMTLIFDKLQKPLDMVTEIANVFSKLSNLRFVFLEFSNTTLGELELLTFAKGFVDCKQIEHLTFKYIEKTPLTVMDLIQFITIMAKFVKSPKLDLFFRKIFHPEWEAPEGQRRLDELENIKYVLTKKSLHIQKVLPIELIE